MTSGKMKSVEEARAAMLASAYTLPQELVDLDEALGRTLAADIIARGPQPPFNASAMDGQCGAPTRPARCALSAKARPARDLAETSARVKPCVFSPARLFRRALTW
jgi:hypothetical protein